MDGTGATQHKRKRFAKPEPNGNRYLNLSNLGLRNQNEGEMVQ